MCEVGAELEVVVQQLFELTIGLVDVHSIGGARHKGEDAGAVGARHGHGDVGEQSLAGHLVDLVRASECGLCVEPENVEQTVDAIRKFYREPDFRKRCGENARKVVCERFSKEKGVARYVEICEQIAAENAQKKEKSNGDAQ